MVRKCVQAGEEASATKCDERASERMRGMRKKKNRGKEQHHKRLSFTSGVTRVDNIRNEDFGGTVGEC